MTPLKNTSGQTMGSISHMIANPHGAERGIAKARYARNVGDPSIEAAPGRPATMKGMDVTTIDDPYEHQRSGGSRTLAPTMHRGA